MQACESNTYFLTDINLISFKTPRSIQSQQRKIVLSCKNGVATWEVQEVRYKVCGLTNFLGTKN